MAITTSGQWNTENPWVVGRSVHDEYEDLSGCIRVCAEHATCYREGYDPEQGAPENVVTCSIFVGSAAYICCLWGENNIQKVQDSYGNIDVDDEEERTIVYDGEILSDDLR